MVSKTKNLEQQFKKLDEISHVLLRPGRYIGAVTPHTGDYYIVDVENQKMVKETITFVPALIKIFDEIISNSVDFSKTPDGKHVTTIKVNIDRDSGEISIFDDGGIIVQKHKEHDQYIPELVFELRAGSNFNDDEDTELTGQNGEGAALTAIFSTSFNVKTCDGKNSFEQTHLENSRRKTTPRVKPHDKKFTKITFTPDYEKFGLTKLDDGNYAKLVKRVYDVAGCNTSLKVFFNDKQIKIKSFEDYVKFYKDDYVYADNAKWKIAVAHSDDGFNHISFVNGTETTIGGNHVKYITDQITVKLREYFKKKHKVDVKPNEILNHVQLFIDASIVKPRYSSQTKEDLITEIKQFGTTFDVTDRFINKIIQSTIIHSVLDWVETKAEAVNRAELRKLNKDVDKTNLRKIIKFSDAATKNRNDAILFITEGQSAQGAINSAKDPNTMGSYPLRGKPVNVMATDNKKLLENEEFKELLSIIGLKIGEPAKNIRFGKIAFCADADHDGSAINGLLINLFYSFWPDLFTEGRMYVFRTPIVKVTQKGIVTAFYTNEEWQEWQASNTNSKFTFKYYKGLGSSLAPEFKEYFKNMDKHLVQIVKDDKDNTTLRLIYSKDDGMSNKRKEWLELIE